MLKKFSNKRIASLLIGGALFAFSTHSSLAANIDEVLAAQPDDVKARYQYRNPKETLAFLGIKEGMTVVEALPGRGWYSKLLLPILGSEGKLIGADYAMSMWGNFSFMTPERIEEKKDWVNTWTTQANGWRAEGDAGVAAFQFDALPDDMKGTVDAALFIRALHNMARFEDKGRFLTNALNETHAILKPGGIVGVVQHMAREDRDDEWADGSSGYLKQSAIIAKFEQHGFEFVAESDINHNEKDQAKAGDIVWRLPPSLNGSRDDAEKKAAMEAIGESNRMTLLFKKTDSQQR